MQDKQDKYAETKKKILERREKERQKRLQASNSEKPKISEKRRAYRDNSPYAKTFKKLEAFQAGGEVWEEWQKRHQKNQFSQLIEQNQTDQQPQQSRWSPYFQKNYVSEAAAASKLNQTAQQTQQTQQPQQTRQNQQPQQTQQTQQTQQNQQPQTTKQNQTDQQYEGPLPQPSAEQALNNRYKKDPGAALRTDLANDSPLLNALENKLQNSSVFNTLTYWMEKGAAGFESGVQNVWDFYVALGKSVSAMAKGIYGQGKAQMEGETAPDPFDLTGEAMAQSLTESQEKREQIDNPDENPQYEKVRQNALVKGVGDLSSSIGNMIPAIVASNAGVPRIATSMIYWGQGAVPGYDKAKAAGADDKTALTYAFWEGLNNTFGEELIGGAAGLGKGLLDKPLEKVTSVLSKTPLAKTLSKYMINALGEGAEEVVQGLFSTAAERVTYDPDATVDVGELAYEGIIGAAMGGVFGAVTLPRNYRVYRADYDLVNNLSKAAAEAASKEEAEAVRMTAESIVQQADEILSDQSSAEEDVERAKYIKSNVEEIANRFDTFEDDIVSQNEAAAEALENIADGPAENLTENAAALVDTVAKTLEPDEDATNAALDYLRENIQQKTEEAANAADPEAKQQAESDKMVLTATESHIRNHRKEVEAARKKEPTWSVSDAYAAMISTDGNDLDALSRLVAAIRGRAPDSDPFETANAYLRQTMDERARYANETNPKEGTEEFHSLMQEFQALGQAFRTLQKEEAKQSIREKLDQYDTETVNAALGFSEEEGEDFRRSILESAQNQAADQEEDFSDLLTQTARDKIEERYTKQLRKLKRNGAKKTQTVDTERLREMRKRLTSTAVTIPENAKQEIPDFTQYRSKAGRDVRMRNTGGIPIDTWYRQLSELYPEYFSSDVTSETDMLLRMVEVSKMAKEEMQKAKAAFSAEDEAAVSDLTKTLVRSLQTDDIVSPNPLTKRGNSATITTEPEAPSPVIRDFSLTHTQRKHTKTGETLDVFQTSGSLSKEAYARLRDKMKAIGGYWSGYVRGFIVPSDKTGEVAAFANVEEEDTAEKSPKEEAKSTAKETAKTPREEAKAAEPTTQAESTSVEPTVEAANTGEDTAKTAEAETVSAERQIAESVTERLKQGETLSFDALRETANAAYGGTMSGGDYSVKDMTDAMELGVNQYILDLAEENPDLLTANTASEAQETLSEIERRVMEKIPTQTKRTDEQIRLQQFSTPPTIAYLASYAANVTENDAVLEPSAGVGGLAVFAKANGAQVVVNEISENRLALLHELPFDEYFSEDAAQVNNILPDEVSPTVVLMNPPFSSTGGRTKNSTKNAIPHLTQALLRLQDGGRLVAVVGKGMADDAPTFRSFYDELRKTYTIRANIGIDGENYRKYGTTFDVRLLVIDKTGPQTGTTVTGEYKNLADIPAVLEEIRNDRVRKTDEGNIRADKQSSPDKVSAGDVLVGNKRQGRPSATDGMDASGVHGRGNAGGARVVDVGERAGRSDSGERSGEIVRDTGESGTTVQGSSVRDGMGQSGGSGDVLPRPAEELVQRDAEGQEGIPGGVREVRQSERRGRLGDVVDRGHDDTGGRSDTGAVQQSGGSGGSEEKPGRGGVSEKAQPERQVLEQKAGKKAAKEDNGVFASYESAALTVKGAKKHPAKLVESSAMSAVRSPALTYVPHLEKDLITSGKLSDAQLENISYAGQAHEKLLPDGTRKGYFIGDGTGVGKGRQLAGIILDNFNQGRKKAIWISASQSLYEDAVRDWVDLGGKESDVINFSKDRKKIADGTIGDGILFLTYDTLRSKTSKQYAPTLDILTKWAGDGFDGPLLYDESHKMANLIPIKKGRGKSTPSQKAIAGDKLQTLLPNARVVYSSATGATNIENLAYASRLGLWGEGTQFSTVQDFVSKIGRAGISAMELVARDMKAMGVYLARSISMDGVEYERVTHHLAPVQRSIYDKTTEAWQIVLQNFDKAAAVTGLEKKGAGTKRGNVYGYMQRFYNYVLSSMSMPSVIEDIEKELAAGHSCVIQLVNTNESSQKRAENEMKESGIEDLDALDLTPRELLINYVKNCFPVEQYEEYLDEKGNKAYRVVKDSKGKKVLNKEAVKIRDNLLLDLAEVSVPEGPLDLLLNHFGADHVAEISGRKNRILERTDENGNTKKVKENRNSANANSAETKDFQDGKKRILVFSGAGATGRSYHADKRAKNQQRRVHYILQAGWQADEAVQSLGRTNRSNQASAPIVKLVSTDVRGQMRFITSIAKRISQLGALTKGQRQAAGGVFTEQDNLEDSLSVAALNEFYTRLNDGKIEGLDAHTVLHAMGLDRKLYDSFGVFQKNSPIASDITTFLNRILALDVDTQNKVFGAFDELRNQFYEDAKENGTLDVGLETIQAEKAEVLSEEVIRKDETGAETRYVKIRTYNKPIVAKTVKDVMATSPNTFEGLCRKEDGSVAAVFRIADRQDKFGNIVKRYRLRGPNQSDTSVYVEKTMQQRTTKIKEKEWESAWAEGEKNLPEYDTREVHMITGALLPIWNRIPEDGSAKAKRITTDDGTAYLGRVLTPKQVEGFLRQFSIKEKAHKYTGKEIAESVLKRGEVVKLSGGLYGGVYSLARRRVSLENRMELSGPDMIYIRDKFPEIITETIQNQRRYFIPTGIRGENLLDAFIKEHPVRSIGKDSDGDTYYNREAAKGQWKQTGKKKDETPSLDDLVRDAKRLFNVPISVGKTNGEKGIYKANAESVRVKEALDLPTIAHELGHHLDKRYGLRESESVAELEEAFAADLTERGYKKKELPAESVAEYFRTYLQNREEAESRCPKFTEWLEDTLTDKDSSNLQTYAARTNAYFAADLDARAAASIHNRTDENTLGHRVRENLRYMKEDPAGFTKTKAKAFVNGAFTKTLDDLSILRPFGGAYDLAMHERQASQIAVGWLTAFPTDAKGNRVGESLRSILKSANLTDDGMGKLDDYLKTRAALELWEMAEKDGVKQKGKVWADEELSKPENMRARIARLEKENPAFLDLAERIYTYNGLLLSRMVEAGLLTEKQKNELVKRQPSYVPMYRVMDDKMAAGAAARRGYADQSPFKKRKGSTRDTYSAIENIMVNTERVIKASMRNEVMREITDTADKTEGMGAFLERVPPDMVLHEVGLNEVYEKLAKANLQSLEKLDAEERDAFMEDLYDLLGNTLEQWKVKNKQGNAIVTVMKNGRTFYYEVKDKTLATAIKSGNLREQDAVVRTMKIFTNTFKSLTTGNNPIFALKNLLRDSQTGYISSTTTNNPLQYLADLVKAAGDILKTRESYQEFIATGGGYQGSFTSNVDNLAYIKRAMTKRSVRERAAHLLGDTLHLFSKMVDIGESATRLAEYKRARKAGIDALEAQRKAQELTVNFMRRGSATRDLDAVLPYFNAGLQSNFHWLSVAAGKEGKAPMVKFWACNLINLAALSVGFRMLMAYVSGGESEKDYEDLSAYNKNAYYCLWTGPSKFLRIPKQKDMMILETLLERTMELTAYQNPDAFYGFMDYIENAFLPPHSPYDIMGFGTLLSLVKNETFTGAPIVSSAYQDLDNRLQYNENSSPIAIWLGNLLNLSPMQLDFVLDDTTGFVGDFITSLSEIGGWYNDGAEQGGVLGGILGLAKGAGGAIAGKFVADSVYSTDAANIFYDQKEKYNKAAASYQHTNGEDERYTYGDVYGSFKYDKIADFYSKYIGKIKSLADEEEQRAARKEINRLLVSVNRTAESDFDREVADLAEAAGAEVSAVAPYLPIPDHLTKRQNNHTYEATLTYEDMENYYLAASTMFEGKYRTIINDKTVNQLPAKERARVIAQALADKKKEIKKELDEKFFWDIAQRDGLDRKD